MSTTCQDWGGRGRQLSASLAGRYQRDCSGRTHTQCISLRCVGQGVCKLMQNDKQDTLCFCRHSQLYLAWHLACSRHTHMVPAWMVLCMVLCLQSEMSHPQRATQDVSINQHAFIRVHVHPKRFPAVYTVSWKVSTCCTLPCARLISLGVGLCLYSAEEKTHHRLELLQNT